MKYRNLDEADAEIKTRIISGNKDHHALCHQIMKSYITQPLKDIFIKHL
jgi:hypothetical protein